jgi:hypothetical protein
MIPPSLRPSAEVPPRPPVRRERTTEELVALIERMRTREALRRTVTHHRWEPV